MPKKRNVSRILACNNHLSTRCMMTENFGGLGSLEGMAAQKPQISCQKVFLSWLQLHQKWPQGLSIPCLQHDDGKVGRFRQSRRYGCTSVSKRSFCLIPKMAPKARLALSSELKKSNNLPCSLNLYFLILILDFQFYFTKKKWNA